MPSPSTSLASLRPDLAGSLEEFDLVADRVGFIGQRVAPVIDVDVSSGKYGVIPIEQLLQEPDTQRAPGSGYSRGNFTFTQDSFATEEHGHEEPIDDRERKLYRRFFDAEVIAAQRAQDAVLRAAERRLATLIFNSTTWTGAALTTAITNEWDDATNATPVDDIDNAKQKVWDGSGLWPNAVIMNRKVFMNVRKTAQIIDRLKQQPFQDVRASQMTAAALALIFDVEEVIVAASPRNTANSGQAVSLSSIWSDEFVMVAKVARTNDIKEPCIARIMHWDEDGSEVGGTVETYRDENVRSDIVRSRHDVDEKVVLTEAGHLLSNATT